MTPLADAFRWVHPAPEPIIAGHPDLLTELQSAIQSRAATARQPQFTDKSNR